MTSKFLIAAVALTAAVQPVLAQDTVTWEIRLAVDPARAPRERPRSPDERAIVAVLEKRAVMLGIPQGKVEFRSANDIRLRVNADRLNPAQLKMLVRPGRLEFRHLEDIRTSLNPRGRYFLEYSTIQDTTRLQFRDSRRDRPVPAAEFLARCPLIADQTDILPDSARRVEDSLRIAVRVLFTRGASKRLDRASGRVGRILAVALDDEIIGMDAVIAKPSRGRERGSKKEKPDDESQDVRQVDIAGAFTSDEEASYLAIVLNSGALPSPLKVVTHTPLAPSAEPKK